MKPVEAAVASLLDHAKTRRQTERCKTIPDELVSCCDGPPKQIVVLHCKVAYPSIKLCSIENGKEVCSVIERGAGGEAGQGNIVVVGCDALRACTVAHTLTPSRSATQQEQQAWFWSWI